MIITELRKSATIYYCQAARPDQTATWHPLRKEEQMPIYSVYEKLRDARQITDAAVARATGLRRNMFCEWGKGRSNPKYDKIVKIAAFFGVPAALFYKDLDTENEAVNG